MRIQKFDTGLEGISRWQVHDEQHLPERKKLAPSFLPKHGELNEILRRPSLEERLPRLLQPQFIDQELLEPNALFETRGAVGEHFADAAKQAVGAQQNVLQTAADILGQEIQLDAEIRTALAALLRG